MPFVAQQQDKCTACGRTVYQTEKTIVEEKEDKKIYHKTCIRCSFERCNKVLSLGELSSVQGKIYCKPHFKQLFAEKGNFEEAFGIEKKAFTAPAPSTSPGTFVPLETGKAYTEKKETSEATAAKIRKFREDGDSERCTSCNRTVYITEKIVVEEKDNKKPYHKSCLRCSFEGCGRLLDLGTYVSQESVIYCKPHFQQLFKTKGNFDESFGKEKQDKWKNQVVVTEKLSFVPATETDQQKASGDKNKTSEATAAKIRQWRQESESDLCSVCSKTVFNAEKLVVEEKNQKKIYHNSCFKCVQCGIKLDLRNYGTHEGKTYCKPHLKELTMANVKPNVVVSNNLSFVPEVKEDKNVQKSETPAHIAAKFKGLGGAERCRQCDKTVYATEKLIVEELKQQHIYHKTCLRCSKCNIQLDASTYGSAQGVIYCKVHLKQVALPEPVKSENAYFVSPLHQNSDYSPQYTTPDSNDNYNNSNNNNNNDVEGSNSNNTSEELFEQQRQQEQEQQQEEEPVEQYTQEPEQERNQYNNNSNNNSNTSSPATSRKQSIINDSEAPGSPTTDDERRKKREEREKQREEEEKRYQEERSNREREREELRKQRESSSTTDDETSDLERRRKEREERRRKADEEAKKEAEDQERRSEERRKRLEALKNQ